MKREPDIFDYIDYRKYLADYYAFKKEQSPRFSYRYFSRQAGFNSPGYLLDVVKGSKNISPKTMEGFCRILGLNNRKRQYFADLVHFNQAKNPETKRYHYEQLIPVFKKEHGTRLKDKQYEFYSNWYGPVIREMVGMRHFNESPEWISKKLKNLVTPAQAKKMLETLLELNLVTKGADGKLSTTETHLCTPPEVSEVVVTKFHKEMLDLAKESLEKDEGTQREISCLTAALTPAKFETIKQTIQEFETKLALQMKETGKEDEEEEVYQFNFQLFSLTKPVKAKKIANGGENV